MINNVGILGLGSIGKRHAQVLNKIDKKINFFAYRTGKGSLTDIPGYITNVGKEEFFSKPLDISIISNPSSMHLKTLKEVIESGNSKMAFVEKPFCLHNEIDECKKLLSSNKNIKIYPGNSLRFHPAINIIRDVIVSKYLGRPIECLAHFGTYMPNWHPYEDYKKSYASKKEMGGGVLLTSIHEIDLVCHLFGKATLKGYYSDNVSLKNINVEDTAHLILTTDKCKVANVSLNFYQKPLSRFLEISFEKGTVTWNFLDKFVSIKTDEKTEKKEIDNRVDAMFEQMWTSINNNKIENFEMDSVYNSLNIINQILE